MSDKGVLFGAVIVGFILVPPMARAWPTLVNGFLFLILFGSLLMHRDVWLPYLDTTARAAGGGGGKKKAASRAVSGTPSVSNFTT